MMHSQEEPPQPTTGGLLGGAGGEDELADRATRTTSRYEWGKIQQKSIDTLRVGTVNAANNLNGDDGLLVTAAMQHGTDIVGFQETGIGEGDGEWDKWVRQTAKDAADVNEATSKKWSSHQANGGRWIGGVAFVTVGGMARRTTYTDDVRGWGRYGTATIEGVSGKRIIVINVYIRADAEGDGDNYKLSTVLRVVGGMSTC